ncbi:hypothetical protein BO78DRAFT_389293 [Aspergillus sclerotiicarbonarius CBS 121057]|uniref:Uncharacterized protein n=1 Tax=Aspergillus sclerotiicarbonarius (strain CBS 121057 / IBT 28362) TaxID=1448318 RepID=A0A319E0P6_ASPSB|nr:hypothetical protein BO78DRAFT_389293 [Aspergillus sclerotiicarbonarius CBS 121057]
MPAGTEPKWALVSIAVVTGCLMVLGAFGLLVYIGVLKAQANYSSPFVGPFEPTSIQDLREALELTRQKRSGVDNFTRGLRLNEIWRHMMIRRTLSSSIHGRKIGDDIPPSLYKTVFLSFSKSEHTQYERWWKQLRRHIFLTKTDSQLVWHIAKCRELSLVTSWLWFRYCHHLFVKKTIRGILQLARQKSLGTTMIKKCMTMENTVLTGLKEAGKEIAVDAFHQIPQVISDDEAKTWIEAREREANSRSKEAWKVFEAGERRFFGAISAFERFEKGITLQEIEREVEDVIYVMTTPKRPKVRTNSRHPLDTRPVANHDEGNGEVATPSTGGPCLDKARGIWRAVMEKLLRKTGTETGVTA